MNFQGKNDLHVNEDERRHEWMNEHENTGRPRKRVWTRIFRLVIC